MCKKNILLIGDLTNAQNYGAIATSESLIDLFREKVDDDHFRTIEYRSFYAETPLDGWPVESNSSSTNRTIKAYIKIVLRKLGLLSIIKKAIGKADDDPGQSHVPVRLSDYEDFTKAVFEGTRLPFEKKMIEWADLVIINSEGNIVNGTDKNGVYRFGGLYVLYMAYLSKIVLNKPCYIINHTVDPGNRDIQEMIKKLYPQMDGIYVRERMSFDLLSKWGVINQRYVPDALFTHNFEQEDVEDEFKKKWSGKIDFTKPYICVGDSSGIRNKYNKVKWDVIRTYDVLIKALKSNVCEQIVFIDGYNETNDDILKIISDNSLASVNLNNCSYHELYYVLKSSELFISGRWHASIIALKAHTPILLFGSDSHKTEALYHEIDWPFFFFDNKSLPINIDRICGVANQILNYDCSNVWGKVDELSVLARQNTDMLN